MSHVDPTTPAQPESMAAEILQTPSLITATEAEQFTQAQQQFKIFVNPSSYSTPLCTNLPTTQDYRTTEHCEPAIDVSPTLTQPPLQMQFTQGTTQLDHDLVISIPDQTFIQENMEHIQHLLYVEPNLNLQELVLCISFLLQNGRNAADLPLVENCLQRYDAELGDFEPFAYVDPSLQYTRNLIATNNSTWTLLLLCWNPNSASPIHNHPNCECFVRMLRNSLTEYRYNHPDHNNSNSGGGAAVAGCCDPQTNGKITISGNDESQLQCFSMAEARAGMVTLMNDDMGLHKFVNNSDQTAYTLHLYFPPYNSCKIYLNASRVATISNICYHSIRGQLNYFDGNFDKKSIDFDDNLEDICK